jgi:hypothetical protein
MNGYGSLPVTGATVTIGSLVFDQVWLLAVGISIVLAGAMIARFGFRRDKTVQDI